MSLKKIVNNLITLSIIVFIFLYLFNNREILEEVNYNWLFILGILFFSIARYLISSLIDIKLFENVNVNLKFYESLNLTIINTLGNIAAPMKVGSGLKVSYLKTKHGLSIYKYFVVNTHYAIFHLFISMVILLFVILANEEKYQYEMLISITTLFLITISLFLVIKNFDFNKYKNKINKYIFDLISVLNFNVVSKNIFQIIFYSMLHLLFGFINLYLIFRLIGLNNMFVESIYFNLITTLSSVVTITPGNIGILELIHIILKDLYSLNSGQVVFVSIVSRIVSLISLLMLNVFSKITQNDLL
tara:strand:- start:2529 stop:3434 length:906 start_codon:yes stop_codon:yes gene_type:complete